MPISPKKLVSAEDLYDIQTMYGCAISPDGRFVLASVQRVDKQTEQRHANLWRFPIRAGDGQARQFTHGKQFDSSPLWSPDGEQIAFLSNRGGLKRPQVFLMFGDGGEARQLTNIKGEIVLSEWSADGKRLLCMVRKVDPEVLEREKDPKKGKLGIVARHVTDVHYKYDGEGFLPKEKWHVWVIDAKSGKGRPVIENPAYSELSPCWLPDGNRIIFLSNRSEDPQFNPEQQGLWVIDDNGNNLRQIELPIGDKSFLSVSPDGEWIAYFGRIGRGEWWRHLQLWIVPTNGSVPARCLTDQFDYSIGHDTGSDVIGGVTTRPVWSNDSQTIYFQISHHGNTMLHSIGVDGSNLETIVEETGVVGEWGMDRDQKQIVWFAGTMTDPGQLKTRPLTGTRERKLTRLNQRYFRRKILGKVEEIWFKGAADNDLQGWIVKPPDFDPKKAYPSIMEMHGGPLAQYGNFFMHEFQYFAANGYVVYFCNPRGGRGYGEAHAKSIWNDHGGADVDDVMAWANYMKQLDYIDPERMGVTGGSYGGFLTNWIIGHTDMFKAAVTQRSISNRLSSYGSSDVNWLREFAFDNEAPWENLANYWKQSPLQYIGNATTPTLVIHSENDFRCPIEQGEQIYVALKRQGVDTEMVRFPGSSHGLSRNGRTDRRVVRLQHMLRWFEKYLKLDRDVG